MLINKLILPLASSTLAAIISLAAQPLRAQTSSEAQEIAELKREVAELRQEINSLKKHSAPAPKAAAEGPTKTEITYDGKTYVEKTVPMEKSSADKWKLSTSITEMEIYGDVRLRYDYRAGETKSTGPVAADHSKKTATPFTSVRRMAATRASPALRLLLAGCPTRS